VANPFSLSSLVQNEVATSDAIPMMQALGIKNIKLWYEIRNWNDPASAKDFKNIAKYKKAGFNVTVTFHNRNVPSVKQATAFFERVAEYPGATELIDYWEISNEPNLVEYWAGTPQEFIDNQLAPAYAVLHPLGEPVIGGGISWDVSYAKLLMSLGYADHVDYGGFHPYHTSGELVVERAKEAKAAFEGLPMIITEWNVIGSEWDMEGFAREIDIAAQGLRDVAHMNFYFALRVSKTHVGAAGVYLKDGKRNDVIYDVAKGWTP
jgi:hypothetical protein